MRPHRLRVQAFGAFAGTEEVVFDDLEGLFLLHGETGAGKTTLLDAIAFALYGRVPGERGSAKRLRSDHAAAGLSTEVELEATIGGRQLRITRKPEQDRPKKSGVGVTREQAAVRLDERTAAEEWESKSVRVVEADQEIRDLMGMSAEQFFQVVLLPQGQFARFLHASAQDKEALLQKLFSTDRFRAVERWLADRRLAIEKEVAAKTGALSVLIAQVAQAADVAVPDPAPDSGHDPAQWVAELAADAGVAMDVAVGLMADRKRDQTRSSRHNGGPGNSPTTSAAAATPSADIRNYRPPPPASADSGTRPIRPSAGPRSRPSWTRQTAPQPPNSRAADPKERPGPGSRSQSAAPADATVEVLRAVAEEQRVNLGRLDQLGKVARDAADEDENATTARARAARFEADLAAVGSAATQRERTHPHAVQARDTASHAAGALPDAQAAAAAARRLANDSSALVKDRATWDRLYKEHRDADKKADDSRKAALDVREARIDGMRAELAATMTDGSPCPVCGSLDHPDPVEPTFESVSRDQEDAANALADRAAAAADAVGREVTRVETRIGELVQRLAAAAEEADGEGPHRAEADGFPADPLAAALQAAPGALADAARRAQTEAERLEAEATALKTQAAALPTRQRDLEDLDVAIAADKIRLTELADQRAAELDKAAAAAKRAQDHRSQLRAQLGGTLDLDTAIGAARGLADAASDAADAADHTARTAAEAQDAIERALRAAADEGFPATAAAKAALRDAQWRRAAAEQISGHEAETKSVADLLADPDLDIALDPPAPVAETIAEAEIAQHEYSVATGAHATARHTVEELAKLRPAIEDKLAALAPLVQRADQIRQIAELANGNGANQYRMTLSSFVLAARLEEVAQAASERLLTMTAGRYSLAHSDARRGNAKAGLSLLACDSWTGVDRDTATLSGGETFLASLALALGLADVVTAEAAGTPMEALFVDEGFGTLDEETLDEVMNVLDGLRAGGRIVGIVSHVTELRQRIPAQVHVAKGRHGSHVRVTAG